MLSTFVFFAITFLVSFPHRAGRDLAKTYKKFMEGWNDE